ncbi:DNA polymerase III subunit gamma/tau [Pedobacter frigiditerrae]|uniref:DNA polymerase III subunit gamma/tau n=1 Tax=Pedobacter frigiditerrae TaxID=2530452 RepID=A0A4R0MIR8_9SPHI|nr:DNA polymerase III subunit gamma/tau [Pedobacter frigiditerrae]TCC86471.1 DNA polymerase III subunit gamma/tau [Pedobacter frigiditerrae]
MENFIVSARKYRPATFETVVGQQHITGTLQNAIKNNQLAQAFLFCGPRGVGKTTCARILAKTINCTNLSAETEACGTCESCVSFQTGHSFNFHELDAASNNSVDDIRSLIEQVRIPPQAGKYKIYIIDEVHMLSANAFNAFLKTLEEPPSYAIFILATTEKHKILPTILSRCQIFDFNRIQVEDIAGHLNKIAVRENITVDGDGLHIIAQKADGGLRDALSMFDQIVSYTNRNVTYKAVIDNLNILDYDYYFKLTDFLCSGDVSQTLLLFNEILNNGFDGNNFINGLASHFRNLLVGKDAQTVQLLEVSETIKQKYLAQSKSADLGFILTALNLANQCDLVYKNSKNQRLQVELSLIKMCHIPSVIQLANQPTATDSDQDKKKTLISSGSRVVGKSESPKIEEQRTENQEVGKSESLKVENASVADLKDFVEREELQDLPDHLDIPLPTKAPEPNRPITLPKPSTGSIKIQPLSTNTIASLIPSLTNLESIAKSDEDKGPKYITGNEKESFTEEQFLDLWKVYTQKAKDADKIHLYTLMNNDPIINGTEITVLVENLALESTLQDEKVDLLNFLRSALKNYDLQIVSKKGENTTKKRIYTNKDKYAYMVEKNPQIEEMRKRFNLDINP